MLIWFMAVKPEIILTEKVNLKNHVLIEGFPGIGLVGTIAAGYIVEKCGMKPIGHIVSDRFPPIVTIHKGRPYFPARIYKHPTKDFLVLVAEFVMPIESVYPLADGILEFAKKNKIRQIVSLAGMSGTAESPKIFAIASNNEIRNFLKTKNIPLIDEGVTTGISGVLIAKCSAEKYPAMSLLVESSEYPDPKASAVLIEKLNTLIGLEVNVKELLKEAGTIEEKMKKIMSQLKRTKETYQKAEEYPFMYE